MPNSGLSASGPNPAALRLPFHETLRRWRKGCGHKADEAARLFGVSASTWSHWENGRRFPTGHHLALLAGFTGIPVPCLVCREHESCRSSGKCR